MSTPNTPADQFSACRRSHAKQPNDFRDELTDMVIRDLLGPAGGPDEELTNARTTSTSAIWSACWRPRTARSPAASWTNWRPADGDEGEEGAPDSGVPAGSTYFPSSMGLSFVVAAETKEIVVEADWGQYLRVKSDTQQKKDGNAANVWKRNPIVAPPIRFRSRTADIVPRPLHPDHPLVVLQGRMRLTADGWVVTLFMVNQQEERKRRGEPKDEVWVFQPKLRVRGADEQPIFVQRKTRRPIFRRWTR